MPECIQCGSYTKFNGGQCSSCYASKKTINTAVLEKDNLYSFDDEKPAGLSDRDYNYRYSMIKGRIA